MEQLTHLYNTLHTFFNGSGWLAGVFLIVFITLLLNYTANILLNRIGHQLEATENIWDDAFIRALKRPLGFLIWVVGFGLAAQIASVGSKNEAIFGVILPVRSFLIVAILTWFVLRFIREAEQALIVPHGKEKLAIDTTTVYAIGKLLRATVIITAVLAILQMYGINVSAVMAFGGIGGIAIGFAAKDLLANFFGGMMIFLDRPFAVGDWVSSPDRDIEGVVEFIGWRLTRLRTFDKRPLYVPNSTFSTISVQNASRMSNRRIRTHVGVRYDDATKLPVIIQEIEAMLKSNEGLDHNQTSYASFTEFGPSSLNIDVSAFTKSTDRMEYLRVQQDIFFKIIDIIDNAKAECAFPTTTLHIPDGINVAVNPQT